MNVQKKFIGNDQVDDSKTLLSNNAFLRARNAANNANINLIKLNASDAIEFASIPQYSGSPFVTQATVTGSAAAKDLSNLTATAINQDLLPDATNTRNLGSAAKVFTAAYAGSLLGADSQALTMVNSVAAFLSLSSTASATTTGGNHWSFRVPTATFNGNVYAYVVVTTSNVIIQVINLTTGAIVQEYTTTLPNSFFPGGAAVSVFSNMLYLDDADLHSKAAFNINSSTGQITSQASPTMSWSGSEGGMCISADGKVLVFSGNSGTQSFTVASNGNLTSASTQGGSGYSWQPHISPAGTWVVTGSVGYGNGQIMSLNPTTGVLGSPTNISGLTRFAISPDGKHIYDASGKIFSLNEGTGAVVDTGNTWPALSNGGRNSGSPVAVSDDGKTVFSINLSGVVASYSRNATTGALTLINSSLINSGNTSSLGNNIRASTNVVLVPSGFNNASSPVTKAYLFAAAVASKIRLNSLQIQDGTQGTAGYVWTSTDTNGSGAWVAASGANTTLSNLGTTALNADLLPSATNTRSVGSASLAMANVYTRNLLADSGQNMDISANSLNVTAPGGIYFGNILDMNSNLIVGLLDPDRPQAAATKNYVDNAIAGAGGANTALSNLASTSVNADIIPSATNTRKLGSSFNVQWLEINALRHQSVNTDGSGMITGLTGQGANVMGMHLDGVSGEILQIDTATNSSSSFASHAIVIQTGGKTGASTANTGDLTVQTGGAVNTGNSGNLLVKTGAVASGTRGKIRFQDGTEGTAGQVWTSTDSVGSGRWQALSAAAAGAAGAIQFSDGAGAFVADATNLIWNNSTKILTLSPAINGTVARIGNAVYISGFNGDGFFGAGATVSTGGSWTATANAAATSYFGTGGGVDPGSYNIFTDSGLTIGAGFSPTLRFEIKNDGTTHIFTNLLDMHSHKIQNVTDPSSAQDVTTMNWVQNNTANKTLSNLGTTALNASLIPATTGAVDLGNVSKYFGNVYVGKTLKLYDDPGYSFSMELLTGSVTAPSGTSVRHTIRTANGNAMAIYTANQAATVGDLRLETGNSSGGNSGNLTLQTGTAAGTRGKIQFKDGSEGTTGHVWTSTDANGNGHWAAAGGGGASTSLNNLTSTSINANLLPDGNNTRTLGGSSNAWINSYITRIISQFSPDAMYTGLLTGIMANRTGLGIGTYPAPFGLAVNPLWVTSGDDSTNNAIATADINVRTGDKTAGTGNSGSLLLKVGTSSGGTRGKIKFQDGSEGAAGKIWTSTGTAGEGAWAAAPTNIGWNKFTIPYTSFSAASTTTTISVASVPANSYIDEIIVKSTVQFSGGGATSFQTGVFWNTPGDLAGYGSDWAANAPANSLFDDTIAGAVSGDGVFASKTLNIAAQSDVNLNTLTAGSIDVYVKILKIV